MGPDRYPPPPRDFAIPLFSSSLGHGPSIFGCLPKNKWWVWPPGGYFAYTTPTTYFSAKIQISMDHDPGYLKKVVSQNPEGGGEVPVWAHGIWHMAYGIIWSLLENHLAYLLNGTQWYWTMTQATWKKWSRKIPKGGGVPIWAHGRYKFKLIQIQIKIYTSPWISRSPSGQGKLNDTW